MPRVVCMRILGQFEKLLLAIVPLGILHHVDHVLRSDHAGWPFRPEVTAFTFTLLIYPILAFAWRLGTRSQLRALSIGIVAAFVLLAHTLIEPPQQIYGTWAHNRSTDALLYTVDPEHTNNLFNVQSPLAGAVAASLAVLLTGLIITAFFVAVRDVRDSLSAR
jgi:predicted lysophospholipase L1 biosynthesis ABC-type transport system permease subunit